MPDELMWVHTPDGAELSQSRKNPGTLSPLTRDGDKKLGQVTLSHADEDDGFTKKELLGALVIVGVAVGAGVVAAPHIKRWWGDRAAPFLKKSRNRLAKGPRARDDVSVAERRTSPQSAATESSQEVLAALDEYRASMGSAEARERFVAALVARRFSDEQLRVLRNARIEDEDPARARAMETLTPEQLGEGLTALLEANPSWADEDILAEIGKILGRSSEGDGERVPVSSERTKRALHRPGRGE